ncbi:MAG: RNase adapter RapZ [Gammaproteobacteria bacterium]|nr:RNase adapter RapZ [Gammaproteobacteria bacterium]MDH5777731.1 RNase adapter RapZ [Gammaproteobacteria bacterium]
MRLVIISGMSGSGKSVALHALEDIDYYCIDNLPIGMLPAFSVQILSNPNTHYENFAVGIDVRNLSGDLSIFPELLEQMQSNGLQCDVVFLDADDVTLMKRFSETRRKHPLTSDEVPLSEAIKQERKLLEPVTSNADLVFETTQMTVHQLRELVRQRILGAQQNSMSLLIESFGFKHSTPVDANFVFDIRCIPNPHWVPELRSLTGLDQPVIDYLEKYDEVQKMYNDIRHYLDEWIPSFAAENRSYLTIAIGCTGGQHRSVYMVEKLAAHFRNAIRNVLTRHREME